MNEDVNFSLVDAQWKKPKMINDWNVYIDVLHMVFVQKLESRVSKNDKAQSEH